MYLQMANGHKYNIDCLKTVRVGGSPLRAELQETITKNLLRERIPIKQGYGSTEQGSITNWPMESDMNTVKSGSVGKAGYGVQIKVNIIVNFIHIVYNYNFQSGYQTNFSNTQF